ncbi:zinc ribbon domain-containing protein [Demequina sp.]|uniref:zinc ribbon domain-containing protein n=1 Tax=Demequina sp. TaxID=2050685 RepID=UPI003D15342D
MPTAPAADQKRLLDVQAADLRAQQAAHRRKTLPVLGQLDELTARVVDLGDERAARGATVGDLRREVTKIEDDVAGVRARAERDNARLNSGQGTPKDLQALSSELEVLQRRTSELEDVELEAMERLEAAEAELASAETQHAEIAKQIDELEQQRDAAFAEIDAELAEIADERVKAAEGLDTALLVLYEKLRDQHGGIGAAPLVRGQCQGCHMTLNAGDLSAILAASPDQVVRCEECGRILVREA